jgi:undecaprenyl-diphosphatase
MTLLQAIILGVVQGLTEFLPVSSSAHLTLAGQMMGLISSEHPERWTAFVAVTQLGTLVAVLVYFRRDIVGIVQEFWRENKILPRAVSQRIWKQTLAEQSHAAKMGWYVILGTLPIATVGFVFKKIIEGPLTKNLTVIAIGLIALSIILILAERLASLKRSMNDVTWRDALVVGCAQVLALLPGPSRSGTTIAAGLFLGLQRDVAARFSFLLSIPAVFASGVLEARHVEWSSLGASSGIDPVSLGIATLVAGISGYAAIAFLLRYLGTHTTMVFVVYRLLLGASILLFSRS